MTNWQQIADSAFAVPVGADADALARELAEALADPDPVIRDGAAYSVLATWIRIGVLDDQLASLGAAMAARFADRRIQARAFAPLVLAWVVERGGFELGWVDAFEAWYPAEADLRGYDSELGWLHAVAHGADLLGALGRGGQVEPGRMLNLAARRMLAETEFVWRDQEDDRLAYAIALTLTRPELSGPASTSWLVPVAAKFAAGEPGPVPPFASNTMRTLRMLYLLADRGVRPEPDAAALSFTHRGAVLGQLADTLAQVAWFTG
jgi:Protein of unknown function (DUF2785)